jgi:hypothetical protein
MPDPVALSDRGEMGGKRRKALHERAGWKEMEDDAHRDKAPREDEAAGTFEYNEVTGAIVGGTPAIPAAAPLDAAPVGEAVGGIEMAVAAAAAATAAVDEAALEEDDDDDGKPTRGRGGKAAG